MKYFDSDGVQKIGEYLGLKGAFIKEWGTFDILSIVCPSPQVETVEVKRWMVVETTSGKIRGTGTKHDMETNYDLILEGLTLVELTGTYEREIKPKVKLREEVGTIGDGYDADNTPIPQSAKLFAEWEE